MKRRKFITMVSTSLVASPIMANFYQLGNIQSIDQYTFPKLPYAFNALEPYIDKQTMELHYSKHHRGYFTKFTDAIKDTPEAKLTFNELFSQVSKLSSAIRNNGGGFYNHSLFWENMSPKKTEPSMELKKAIEKDFGSIDQFKDSFGKAAKTQFGSGWAWLSVDNKGRLFVSSTQNQDNPLMDVVEDKGIPLLALDIWEHAYYLKYQNRRAEYVDNFWNIVNWGKVNERFNSL